MNQFQNKNRIFTQDTFGAIPHPIEPDTPTFNPLVAQHYSEPFKSPVCSNAKSRWDSQIRLFDLLQRPETIQSKGLIEKKDISCRNTKKNTPKKTKVKIKIKAKAIKRKENNQKGQNKSSKSKIGNKKRENLKQQKIHMFLTRSLQAKVEH